MNSFEVRFEDLFRAPFRNRLLEKHFSKIDRPMCDVSLPAERLLHYHLIGSDDDILNVRKLSHFFFVGIPLIKR